MKIFQVGEDHLHSYDSKTDSGVLKIPIHSEIQRTVSRMVKIGDNYLASGEVRVTSMVVAEKELDIGLIVLKKLSFVNKRPALYRFRSTLANRFENARIPENISAKIIGNKIDNMTDGLYADDLE